MEKREEERQLRKDGKKSSVRVGRTNINPDSIDEGNLEKVFSRHCFKDKYPFVNRRKRMYGLRYVTLDVTRKLQDNLDDTNVERFYASSVADDVGTSADES